MERGNTNVKKLKWVGLLLACLLLVVSLTACLGEGYLYPNAMKIDGEQIPGGVYLMLQFISFSDAATESGESGEGVLSATIDGMKGIDWIRQETERKAREMVYVERTFEAEGLELSDDAKAAIEQTMSTYQSYATYYSRNGIGEDSFRRVIEMQQMKNDLIIHTYSAGGSKAMTDEELTAAYAEQFVHLKYINFPITGPDSLPIEDQAALDQAAQDMLAALDEGSSWEMVTYDFIPAVYELLGRSADVTTVQNSLSNTYLAYDPEVSTTYDPAFLSSLKNREVGYRGIERTDTIYIVYEVLPTFEDQDALDAARDNVILKLKTEEFDAAIEEIYMQYEVSVPLGAMRFFSPKKMV